MKSKRLIQRELEAAIATLLENRRERIFAVFPTLTRLRSFLHITQHQALQLIRTLNLILAAATDRSLVREQLIEQQVEDLLRSSEQKQTRVPRPQPLALRPATPNLAPPA